MKTLAILALMVCTVALPAQDTKRKVILSDKEGWHKLGEVVVDYKQASQEIKPMGANKFAYVRFKILNAPVSLSTVQIMFDNDEVQDANIGAEISEGGETETIALTGGERDIKKVIFNYQGVRSEGDKRARIEVWGMKTNTEKTGKRK